MYTRRYKICSFFPAIVVKEPDLDVFLVYFLTQDDDLLASISRGGVVKDVHDLQFFLGLGIDVC